MTMTPIAVSISGTTPLLCGRPSTEAQAIAGDPQAQAESRLYRNSLGLPVIPGLNLYRCMAGAARHVGRCPVELVHSLGVAERDVSIQSDHPWIVDTRMVRHPETGERSLCYRPRFDDWRLDLTILVDRDALSGAEVRSLLETAGMLVGLGDFRPERGGPFGRFIIDSWEVLT
jgi:hypothetical protein